MAKEPIYGQITSARYDGNSVLFQVESIEGEIIRLTLSQIYPGNSEAQNNPWRLFMGNLKLTKDGLEYESMVFAKVKLTEDLKFPHHITDEEYVGLPIIIYFPYIQ